MRFNDLSSAALGGLHPRVTVALVSEDCNPVDAAQYRVRQFARNVRSRSLLPLRRCQDTSAEYIGAAGDTPQVE